MPNTAPPKKTSPISPALLQKIFASERLASSTTLAWLSLFRATRAAREAPSDTDMLRIAQATARIEALPAKPHRFLARGVHAHLLAIASNLNPPGRFVLWPALIRANSACVRAGHRAAPEKIDTMNGLRCLLSSQSSFPDSALPPTFARPRLREDYTRVQFFWTAVASDSALADFWNPESFLSRAQQTTFDDAVGPHHLASLSLRAISLNKASAELISAMNFIHEALPGSTGPFTSLASLPLPCTERWIYEGWPSDLAPLAADLARRDGSLLLDLLCLAYAPPPMFAHYPCRQTGGNLLQSLRSLATPGIIGEYHSALNQALSCSKNRLAAPPEMTSALEAFALREELSHSLASTRVHKAPRRL